MKFSEYPDREMMMLGLANILAGELSDFIRREGRASFCVPGGTTPGPIFDTLSGVDLDWENIAVFLNDERWVPETDARSNTALIKQRLIRGRAAKANLIPLYAATPQPEDALDALSKGIAPHLPISVLLLGMGTDMHTASLFPGADRLADALAPDAPILLPMRAEAAGEPRVTLTARVLRDAMSCHILITGAEKRTALERAQGLSELEAPVKAVLANAIVHWAE
jgi:6-phosphogluconolactonase